MLQALAVRLGAARERGGLTGVGVGVGVGVRFLLARRPCTRLTRRAFWSCWALHVQVYKRKDPAGADEVELLENVFDSLCSTLLEPDSRRRFLQAEGVELLNILIKCGTRPSPRRALAPPAFLTASEPWLRERARARGPRSGGREKKMARAGALKTLSYAMNGPDGAAVANRSVAPRRARARSLAKRTKLMWPSGPVSVVASAVTLCGSPPRQLCGGRRSAGFLPSAHGQERRQAQEDVQRF